MKKMEARGYGAPGVAVQIVVNHLMKVLETELGSSTREVCTFNC